VTASAKEELAHAEERHRAEIARIEATAAAAAASTEKEQAAQVSQGSTLPNRALCCALCTSAPP